VSEPLIRPIDYVLGELGDDERHEAEQLLAVDAGFRAEVERLEPVAAMLRDAGPAAWAPAPGEALEPPPLRVRPAEPAERTTRRRRLALSPALAAVAAALLLAAGAVGGVLASRGGDAGQGETVVLAPLSSAEGRARGEISAAGSDVRLRVADLPPSRGDYYELWLLGARGQAVSLGSFRVGEDGAANVTLPLPVDPRSYRYLDVSREPVDGNPAHSGTSVLRGPSAA